jgi:hypothetical protein
MKIRYLLLFLVMKFHCAKLIGQYQDMQWLFGSSSINYSNLDGFAWGQTKLDFAFDPPLVYYDSLVTLDFAGTNSSICDDNGKLLFYTNGMSIHTGQHRPLQGADTISYGQYWEQFNEKDYPNPGQNWPSGFLIGQGALILPWPEENNTFAVIYDRTFYVDDPWTGNLIPNFLNLRII